MRNPEPNWDLRRIPVSFPYVRLLVLDGARRREPDGSSGRPRMEREHRAKIFAPFDALDGFSEQIRSRNDELVDAMESRGR